MEDTLIRDFELPATGEKTLRLSDFSHQTLILYFYPKDNTPGCTLEAQEFRDLYPAFRQMGCIIVGVSRDSLRSHESFRARLKLPFDLISDTDETLCTHFDVIKEKKLYGKQVRSIERSTFVIDGQGGLLRAWRGIKTPGHAQEVLDFIRSR